MNGEKRRVTIPLPLKTYQELQALAASTDRSVPQYVRQIVMRYLEKRGAYIEPWEYFRER